MPAFATSKIGKFAFAILSVSGSSLLLANVLSFSLRDTPLFTTNSLTRPKSFNLSDQEWENEDYSYLDHEEEEERKDIDPEKKKCKVLLTSNGQSENQDYQVVACDNPTRNKTWYLFDGKKGSLERIDGLTTKNDTGSKALESKDSWWKDKEWQGYRGRATQRSWGKEEVGSPFVFKYESKTDSTKFPFFNYLRLFCQGWELRRYRGLRFLDSSCSHFDVPFEHFKIHLIGPHLKQAFGPEKDICLVRDTQENLEKKWEMRWKEEECIVPTHK